MTRVLLRVYHTKLQLYFVPVTRNIKQNALMKRRIITVLNNFSVVMTSRAFLAYFHP